MSHITTERANELFWLGRYAERVYTTVNEFSSGFDRMIDESSDSHQEYCRRVNIPDVYADKDDFLSRYPFDDSIPDSIISNLIRAYDNAVVLRDDIGSDTLAYVQMAVYDMRKAAIGKAPLVGLLKVIDDLYAFWGCLDDSMASQSERSIVKTGRRVERVDLYLRFGIPEDRIQHELNRLETRIRLTGLKYDVSAIGKIREMVSAGDRRGAVILIESFIDV